jgi:molecular chaperone HscB
VPADLLEEVFELNMQIDEMRAQRKAGENDAELSTHLTEARKRFEGLVEEVDSVLRDEWRRWDQGDEDARRKAQHAMVALLDRRRYLSNLVRDVTETLAA